jgi:hypothetical protein
MSHSERRNQYDHHQCLEQGERAEQRFVRLVQQRGWQATPAPAYADIHAHWDYLIQKQSRCFKVDIKAMKRIQRHDAAVQDTWLWIELHGVRPHDPGWLYGGAADLIAVEIERGFVLVKRLDLIELVAQLVQFEPMVTQASAACYRVYSRPNRPDRLTLIETAQLYRLQHFVLS